MTAYLELTGRLADAFPKDDDWLRVPTQAGMSTGSILLQGPAISAWNNILRAALDQNRLEGLRERIALERPDILPVFDRFADEASKGPLEVLDLPSLANIQIRPEDLEANRLSAALDFGDTIPPIIWNIALSDAAPSRTMIDPLLSRTNLGPAMARRDQFLLECTHALAPLKQRRSEVVNRMNALQSQASAVERMARPNQPTAPSQLADMSDDLRRYWSDRYSEQMNQYRRDLASYETSQATLPKLRQDSDAALGDLRQVEAAIGSREAQTNAGLLPFSEDVERARDADILLLLDSLANSGLRAFDTSDPLKGFAVSLASGCVLEALVKIFVQPSAATEAGRRFGGTADAASDVMRRNITEIVRPCLGSVTLVQAEVEKNEEATKALLTRLGSLRTAQLETGLDRAARLLSQGAPQLPSLGEIEKPQELEQLRQDLTDIQASAKLHVSQIRAELDAEVSTFAATSSAADDAKSTLAALSADASANKTLLERTWRLYGLLAKAGVCASLPKYTRTLCLAIRQEVSRRNGVSPDALLTKARSTELGYLDARSAVEGHILTRYRASRPQLEVRMGEGATLLEETGKLLTGIDERYHSTAASYRQRIRDYAISSYIPGVGLLFALGMAATTSKLLALLNSDKAPYADLQSYALKCFLWAIVGNVTAVAAVGSLLAFYYAGILSAEDYTQLLYSLALASGVALLISIRNMWLIRGHKVQPRSGTGSGVVPPVPQDMSRPR
ncbi:prefoldin subunit 5 [Bradyrhizobium sp. USDA 4472]